MPLAALATSFVHVHGVYLAANRLGGNGVFYPCAMDTDLAHMKICGEMPLNGAEKKGS